MSNEWVLLWRYKKTANKKRALVASIHAIDKSRAIWPSPVPKTLTQWKRLLEPRVFESYAAAENSAVATVKNIGFKEFTA